MTSALAERVLRSMLVLLPRERRDLGVALLAELAVLPPRRRLPWVLGGIYFVVKERMMRPAIYLSSLLASMGILVVMDRATSELANQLALGALIIGSGILGFAAPRWAWLSAFVLGSTVAVTHLVYLTVGPALPYAPEPPGLGGAATLLVLILPALLCAYLGAGARRLVRRPS